MNALLLRLPSPLCLALLVTNSGCGARPDAVHVVAPPSAVQANHDTIGEFRKDERIACAQGTDLVYVLSHDGGLHSFDPTDLQFRKIGTLACPATEGSQPHSMAVDRSGQAWIGYSSGAIVRASISDAHCTASNVERSTTTATFGMGFAPTAEGRIGGETLFLSTAGPDSGTDGQARRKSMLYRIDDGTNITVAGEYPPPLRGLRAELSSRSDGRLFAFFTGDPFVLAEIDPASADVRWQRELVGMRFSTRDAGAWAFAAVGSEFFFFWAEPGATSTVTRLRADGTLEHVIASAGLQIVGAGASTCATRTTSAAAMELPQIRPSSASRLDGAARPRGEESRPAPSAPAPPPKTHVSKQRAKKPPEATKPAAKKRRWPRLPGPLWWLS